MRFALRLTVLSLFVWLGACPGGFTNDQKDGGGNGGGESGGENSAPAVAGVKLSAGPYYVSTTLTAKPGSKSDPDGDEVTLTYQWYVNDQAVKGASTQTLADAFAPGDEVYVKVTPTDGTLDGAPVQSATVTIENRSPTAPFIALYPAVPAEGPAQTLWTKIITAATDPDGTALSYEYRWYLDGVLQSFATGQTAVTVTLVEGQTWRVDVVASDGQAASAAAKVSRTVPFVAAAIDAGGFACAVTTKGAVLCWGSYTDATLTQLQRTPVVVEGLTNIKAVSVGGAHACALTTGGGVKCWGYNTNGELGASATSSNMLPPVDVLNLASGVAAIASGSSHTCALTTGGGVKCWGYNGNGELGNGNKTSQSSPVNVTGLASGVAAIAAGGAQTCALTTGGGVKCWGNGTVTPTDVAGLTSGVAKVTTGGKYICTITTGGASKCMGQGKQLGDGTTNSSATPVDVIGLSTGVTQIDASSGTWAHACALANGNLWCWGSNNQGQTGNGDKLYEFGYVLSPATVQSAGKSWAAIATGSGFTCAMTDAGAVYCWGRPDMQGTGKTGFETVPVASVSGVKKLALDVSHACALKTDDTVACWGALTPQMLGLAQADEFLAHSPVALTAVAGPLRDLTVGENHLCVLTSTGIVKCMGGSGNGVLGDGNWQSPPPPGPVQAINLLTVTALGGGPRHNCALEIGGSIKCWGDVATYTGGGIVYGDNFTPRQVTAFSGLTVARMTVGEWISGICGILSDNTAKCFHEPVADQGLVLNNVPIAGGVLAVHKKSLHGCAVSSAGAAKCWGANDCGELGNGLAESWPESSFTNFILYDVVGLSTGVKNVVTATRHSCALTTLGGVKCWGYNQFGQLGDGTTTDRAIPVDVVGLTGGVASIYAQDQYTCAVLTNGNTKCWGAGNFGNETPETAGWVPYRPVVGFVP